MAEHGGKAAPKKGAEKKSGGGFWNFLGDVLSNVSLDINVGTPGRPGAPSRNPTDPASRMEPVHAEREEAYQETIYRKTEGADGIAPAVRVDRDRQAIARSLDGRMNAQAETTVPQGGGSPLSRDVRAKMEPRLGSDLSDVRVHTSGQSAAAAEGLSAKAFTVGKDVHFGSGNYQPGTKEGDRLIAHELTHVVQGQRSGVQRKEAHGEGEAKHDGEDAHGSLEVSQPGDPAEKEADAVADKVTDDIHASDKTGKGGGAKATSGHGEQDHGAHNGAKAADGSVPRESAPPIGAKLAGSVGRKIFRSASAGLVPSRTAAQPSIGLRIFRKGPTSGAPPGQSSPPGTDSSKAQLRKKIEKERDSMQGASSLSALGGKIAGAAKPGVAPTRLANTVESAARARAYFDGPGAAQLPDAKQRKEAFVESRMGPALADQKAGIKKSQDDMLAKKDEQLQDVDYDKAQNYAAFGPNSKAVLAPENLNSADAQASVGAVQKKGGLAKVIGLGTFWKAMDDQLKQQWTGMFGAGAAEEWKRQSRAALKPLTAPQGLSPMRAKAFAKWSDPASAFNGPLFGAMGVVDEYSDINSFADAKAKLGLDEQYYDGGFCFMCFIPGANVPGAVQNAAGGAGKDQKANIGKPSLYSSLVWAEFNYIAEDRTTNTTADPKHGNTGAPDPKGKTEVNVANISYAELFSQPVRVIK